MVSKTQVVKYVRKSVVMRGPQDWNDCELGYAFQAGGAGEQWKDVVLYNGNYYSCKTSHVKTELNYPNSDADSNNDLWQLGDKIELVATKILLATYALVENLGVTAIDMKDKDGNILFQAKDGNVTCKTGTFDGINVLNANIESGKIAGFYISGNGLTNNSFNTDAYIIFRNDDQGAFAGIGGNVLPTSSGARSMARFENTGTIGSFNNGTNYAITLAAQGAKENCAIYIDGGYISGLALKNKIIESTTTLSRFDQHIITINTTDITIYLPTMQVYDDGHIIRIKWLGSGTVRLAMSSCYTFNGNTTRYSRPVLVYDINKKMKNYETMPLTDECNAMDLVWVRDIVHTIDNVKYYGAWIQYKMPRDW